MAEKRFAKALYRTDLLRLATALYRLIWFAKAKHCDDRQRQGEVTLCMRWLSLVTNSNGVAHISLATAVNSWEYQREGKAWQGAAPGGEELQRNSTESNSKGSVSRRAAQTCKGGVKSSLVRQRQRMAWLSEGIEPYSDKKQRQSNEKICGGMAMQTMNWLTKYNGENR